MELAGSGEWDQARTALLAGARRNPGDKRYPLELAGIEYRRKNPAAAKHYLRRALELDSADRYANDFLGTLYYLEGNLEAALRYWNRIEKPRVDDVKIVPAPRLNPVVVDSALAFAPGSLVTLDGWRTTRARLDGLDVFGNYRLEVRAETEERFDAELGWLRPSAWMTAVSMVRGLAYKTVEPELRDIGGSGSSWTSLVRWDAQKRRAATELAGPVMHNAKWRYRWYADARSETWNTGGLEDFRLRKMATGAEFEAIPNGTVTWRSGFEVSSRGLANLAEFRGGTAVAYRAARHTGKTIHAGLERDVGTGADGFRRARPLLARADHDDGALDATGARRGLRRKDAGQRGHCAGKHARGRTLSAGDRARQ